MKRIIMMAALALAFVSCYNNETTDSTNTDSTSVITSPGMTDTSGANYGADSVNEVDTSDRADSFPK